MPATALELSECEMEMSAMHCPFSCQGKDLLILCAGVLMVMVIVAMDCAPWVVPKCVADCWQMAACGEQQSGHTSDPLALA